MNESGELRLIVSEEADTDTDDIEFYIAMHNEDAGRHFSAAVRETFTFLLENPGAGWMRERVSNQRLVIRQWPVRGFSNYLIFYRPMDDGIRILRVLHGAQTLSDVLD